MSDRSFYTSSMKARLKFLSYSNFSLKLKIWCVYCIVSIETDVNLSAEINDSTFSADFYGRMGAKWKVQTLYYMYSYSGSLVTVESCHLNQ